MSRLRLVPLTEDHYIAGRWSDCISNARKFLESILEKVYFLLARQLGVTISEKDRKHPADIRKFIENNGLLEREEREAIDKIYGLLSHTGGHPYMAEKDQARLLRQMSLVMAQFIMLRMEGALKRRS